MARARRTSSARVAFWIAGLTTDWRAAVAGLASGLLLVAYDESVLPGGGFGDFLFSAVILTGVWAAHPRLRTADGTRRRYSSTSRRHRPSGKSARGRR